MKMGTHVALAKPRCNLAVFPEDFRWKLQLMRDHWVAAGCCCRWPQYAASSPSTGPGEQITIQRLMATDGCSSISKASSMPLSLNMHLHCAKHGKRITWPGIHEHCKLCHFTRFNLLAVYVSISGLMPHRCDLTYGTPLGFRLPGPGSSLWQ